MTTRAGVGLPRCAVEHQLAGGVHRKHTSMRVRRQYRPRVQQVGKTTDEVVRVQRLAGDVAASALVMQAHAASYRNFASRLSVIASRYAAEPRWSPIGCSVSPSRTSTGVAATPPKAIRSVPPRSAKHAATVLMSSMRRLATL